MRVRTAANRTSTTHATRVGRVIHGPSAGSARRPPWRASAACRARTAGPGRPEPKHVPVEADDGHELADRRRREGLVRLGQVRQREPAFRGVDSRPRRPGGAPRLASRPPGCRGRVRACRASCRRRHQTFVVGPSRTEPSAATKMASPAPRRSASSWAAMLTAYEVDFTPIEQPGRVVPGARVGAQAQRDDRDAHAARSRIEVGWAGRPRGPWPRARRPRGRRSR